MTIVVSFTPFLATVFLISSLATAIDCVPNPAYTVPSLPASNPLLRPLRSGLAAAVRQLLIDDENARVVDAEGEEWQLETSRKGVAPPLYANETSFSIVVTTQEETVWTFHHSAEIQGHNGGENVLRNPLRTDHGRSIEDSKRTPAGVSPTKIVDGSTAYRIASCTKVFTVLALLLQEDVNWDDPVTKWIPELGTRPERYPDPADEHGEGEEEYKLMNHVHWESITLRSLASQLSGIARQYAVFDLLDVVPEHWAGKFEELGFPPLDEDDDVPRGNDTSDRNMSREDFLQGVKMQSPIFAPDYQSTYSNTGFILLGMVLEKMTRRKYADIIADRITTPLGMNRTTFLKPDDRDGVIPAIPNDWDWGSEINWPTGGLYSTPDDTIALLRSILRSELLEQERTNKWLQPQSVSAGLLGFYGMPWEIMRTSQATSDHRTVTVFTKGGGLEGYYSDLALVPEFGVGVSILTAGRAEALETLKNTVYEMVLRGMDDILQEWTEKTYTGTFIAEGKLNSSLELGIGETGGLEVKRWISNGTDFLDVMAAIAAWPPLQSMQGRQARLFPTGLKRGRKGSQAPKAAGEVWRMKILQVETRDRGIWTGYCMGDVDEGAYAGRALNEIILFKGVNGRLEKVRIPVLKVELVRKNGLMEGARGLVEQYRW